eukprot:16951-Heterococcus_DN1.PRE.3
MAETNDYGCNAAAGSCWHCITRLHYTTLLSLCHCSAGLKKEGALTAFIEASASLMRRAAAHSSVTASCAVDTVLPPGVFMTITPAFVHSFTSMLSMPTPARPTTFRFGACFSNAAVT